MKRILVIRLGALGDFFLSFGPFAAIRARHAADEVTLLTTAPFAALARRAPWFDRVEVDARPALLDIARPAAPAPAAGGIRFRLRSADLRPLVALFHSRRAAALVGHRVGLLAPARQSAAGLHAHAGAPARATGNGGRDGVPAGRSVLAGALAGRATLPAPYALLVPGASAGRPRKRWPAERFGALAALLAGGGLTPVVVGTDGEAELAATIRAACPAAIDLTGQTALADLPGLAAGAALAVGNDTGPMHVAAAVGCRCVVLFSADSDPALTAPRGPGGTWPVVVRVNDLAGLPVEEVVAAAAPFLRQAG